MCYLNLEPEFDLVFGPDYLGLKTLCKDVGGCAFEVGHLFDRRPRFGDTPLGDAMMLRMVTRY